jgi:hypothetical protein
MNVYAKNLLRIASELTETHPYHAFELSELVNKVAIMQPGRTTLVENIKDTQKDLVDLHRKISEVFTKWKNKDTDQYEDFLFASDGDNETAERDLLNLLLTGEGLKDPFSFKKVASRLRRFISSQLKISAPAESETQKGFRLKKKYNETISEINELLASVQDAPSLYSLGVLHNKLEDALDIGNELIGEKHLQTPSMLERDMGLVELEPVVDQADEFETGLAPAKKPSKKKPAKPITTIDSMLGHLLKVKKDPVKRSEGLKKLYQMLKSEVESGNLSVASRISSFMKQNPAYVRDMSVVLARLAS